MTDGQTIQRRQACFNHNQFLKGCQALESFRTQELERIGSEDEDGEVAESQEGIVIDLLDKASMAEEIKSWIDEFALLQEGG